MKTMRVARGMDTLYLNVHFRDADGKPCKRDLSDELRDHLNTWKSAAIEAEEPIPVPVIFEGANLHMYPNGAGKGQWRWLMTCDAFNLLLSLGRFNCVGQMRLSSDYLWACQGADNALRRVDTFLTQFFGESMYLQVSQVHLCADIAGWDVEDIDPRRDFVSRSRKRAGYEETDLQVQDYTYGLRRSGFTFSQGAVISCTIYDKTREIRQKNDKWWFHDYWQANGWDEQQQPQVWRVEFRYRRESLHELAIPGVFEGVEDAFDLPGQIPAIWSYAVGHAGGGQDGFPDGWLRFVVPSDSDMKRSRWPIHPVWEQVQRAFEVETEAPEKFSEVVRIRKQQANIERLLASSLGYSSSLAAWLGRDGSHKYDEADLMYVLHWMRERAPIYLGPRGRQFSKEVQKKRVRFEQGRQYNRDFRGGDSTASQ